MLEVQTVFGEDHEEVGDPRRYPEEEGATYIPTVDSSLVNP